MCRVFVPKIGAVDLGRFVQMPRHILETGQVNDDRLSNAPEAGEDNSPSGVTRFLEPVRRGEMGAEQIV